MKRLVVLGGGFIGGAVAQTTALLGSETLVLGHGEGPGRVDLDRVDVAQWLRLGDRVLITAWPSTAGASAESGFELAVKLVADIAAACARAQVDRVVFLSSGGTVYGNRLRAREDEPPAPTIPLAEAKLAAERRVRDACGQAAVIARLANVYGPGQRPRRPGALIATAIHCLRTGERFQLRGSLADLRDHVSIDDVTGALALLLSQPCDNVVYNVGTGVATATGDVIGMCERALASTLDIDDLGKPDHWIDVSSVSSSRLAKEFGWRPYTDVEQGIQRLARA